MHPFLLLFSSVLTYEKHAPRVSQVIAAVAKAHASTDFWLVARVNFE